MEVLRVPVAVSGCWEVPADTAAGVRGWAALQGRGLSLEHGCCRSRARVREERHIWEHHPRRLEGLASKLTDPSAFSLLGWQPGSSTVCGPASGPCAPVGASQPRCPGPGPASPSGCSVRAGLERTAPGLGSPGYCSAFYPQRPERGTISGSHAILR